MRLSVTDLAGARAEETVFSNVSFDLADGGALVVTGPNGSGKSTLLRIVAGLLPAAAGSVALDGGGETWPDARAASHYLGHQNGMKAALTISENLAFWRDFLGEPHVDIVEALDMVGLPGVGHLPYAYLSTGQKRRAAIARLLVSYRPLWLLDEPTAGLDAASEAQLAALVEAHRDDGGMVVVATHLPIAIEGAHALRMGA